MNLNIFLTFLILSSIIHKNFQLLFIFMNFIMYNIFFVYSYNYSFWCMNSNSIFTDYLFFLLNFLTSIIILLILMMKYKNKNKFMNLMLMTSLSFLIYCFMMNNLLMLYIFFEISMIPLIFLIFIKSSNKERFKANLYLLMFTLLGSLMFLILISMNSENQNLINVAKFSFFKSKNNIIWVFLILVFLIKSPMYGFHLWLPKAHVEAPVSGSMLLAGILLKLGSFGLNRLSIFINMMKLNLILNFLMTLSLISSFFMAFICLRQTDLKSMIAYSSINHMALIISSMFTSNKIGMSGALTMIIAHGFCSSCLFFMGNMLYIRCKTRNILMMKNFKFNLPILSMIWMSFIFINMGTPPFMNFMSELFMIVSLLKKSMMFMFIIILIIVFNILYNLNMMLTSSHGSNWNSNKMKKESAQELIILLMHNIFLWIFLFKPSFFVIFV